MKGVLASALCAALVVTGSAGGASEPDPDLEQRAQTACSAALSDIASQQGVSVDIDGFGPLSARPATWEDHIRTTRPELREQRIEMAAGDETFAGFEAAQRRQFERRSWIIYTTIIGLAPPFRSTQTLDNTVTCSFLVEEGTSGGADPSARDVRINGATALDHLMLRLPL